MKSIGALMEHTPNADEVEALAHVLDAAHAWKRGDLTLDGMRGYCNGLDRYRAMRAAELASDDKRLLTALTDALVHQDESRRGFQAKHGYICHEEMQQGAKEFTSWRGERVWVWSLFWMHGEPYYPPVHLEPGEARREQEAAMNRTYSEYRKAKGRLG